VKLSSVLQGRDNNFNLIRIVAALAVLITHSFALAIGKSDAEPFVKIIGMSMGSIAVDVFFITSGFLVTASLLKRKSIGRFIWARGLRIFPALLVMSLLSVFALGPFFTSMDLFAYFSDSRTYIYLAKSLTLFDGVADQLPGVFEGNPYKSIVNGSLWTMPYEVKMYAVLAVAWLALGVAGEFRYKIFEFSIVLYALLSGIYVIVGHFYSHAVSNSAHLSFMFFTGAAFYILKDRIYLSRLRFFSFFFAVVLASVISVLVGVNHIFYVIYNISISYIVIFLAFIPRGVVRKYNVMGDYSYGVYIYAFPVQQSIAALIPGVSVSELLLISFGLTLILAVMSWHIFEKHSLSLVGVIHNKRINKNSCAQLVEV
jgi:peptidoglycan/LPS O-acetylase OafA/YrhL